MTPTESAGDRDHVAHALYIRNPHSTPWEFYESRLTYFNMADAAISALRARGWRAPQDGFTDRNMCDAIKAFNDVDENGGTIEECWVAALQAALNAGAKP